MGDIWRLDGESVTDEVDGDSKTDGLLVTGSSNDVGDDVSDNVVDKVGGNVGAGDGDSDDNGDNVGDNVGDDGEEDGDKDCDKLKLSCSSDSGTNCWQKLQMTGQPSRTIRPLR